MVGQPRLCSSGIVSSKLRSPASRWATGTWSLTAASAAASVELTSPATTTRSGGSSSRSFSTATSVRAVCSPCDPEPTPRKLVGLRHPELVEEHLRHALVVVLARVHQAQLDLGGLLLERPVDRGDLHEVRPCADKEVDAGHSAHSAQTAPTRKPVNRSGSAAVSSRA